MLGVANQQHFPIENCVSGLCRPSRYRPSCVFVWLHLGSFLVAAYVTHVTCWTKCNCFSGKHSCCGNILRWTDYTDRPGSDMGFVKWSWEKQLLPHNKQLSTHGRPPQHLFHCFPVRPSPEGFRGAIRQLHFPTEMFRFLGIYRWYWRQLHLCEIGLFCDFKK